MNNFSHISVMQGEAIVGLNVSPGKRYIDATLGGGGHARAIVALGGVVLGIDQDYDALNFVATDKEQEIKEERLKIANGNFRNVKEIATENGFEKVDGALFDLGVSSYQIDNSGRGFSIRKDEPLDMRMDSTVALNAFDVVNTYARDRLVDIFYRYGEEHNARYIADQIVEVRKKEPILTTKQLASLIERIPHKNEPIHPATRVFQAIRIEVNGEIDALKNGLIGGMELLQRGGRLVVISFHSLEDRIVKQQFNQFERERFGKVLTKKPIQPTEDEKNHNRRSRSAKLRIFEKQ